MPRAPLLAAVAAAVALLSGAGPLPARADAIFEISMGGIKVAELRVAANEADGRYIAKGRLATTGLARAVRQVSYDAVARGRLTPEGFAPESYEETSDTGRRRTASGLVFEAGMPRVIRRATPPQPGDADPAAQAGTLDPMTAIHAILRDIPAERACRLDLRTYDGRRAGRVTLAPGAAKGTCRGVFRRVAGYSDAEMAERRAFPFTLGYGPAGEGRLQVVEITLETLYGTARLDRR